MVFLPQPKRVKTQLLDLEVTKTLLKRILKKTNLKKKREEGHFTNKSWSETFQ